MADGLPEPTQEALAKYLPYGERGRMFGRGAAAVEFWLQPNQTPRSRDRQRRWITSDHEALSRVLGLEAGIPMLSLAEEVPIEERRYVAGRLVDSLALYHEALPFAEAERRWLTNAYHSLPGRGSPAARKQRMQLLKVTEGEVVSAGLRQAVIARELLGRWWSWRRETDQFAEQGSLDAARCAIGGIREMLVPDTEDAMAAGIPPWS
jgi:hypothetical protein